MLAAGISGIAGGIISATRLALLSAAFFLSISIVLVAWQIQKDALLFTWWGENYFGKNQDLLTGLTGMVFLASWLIVWTPLENFGEYYYYLSGLFPYILWTAGTSGGLLALLLADRYGINLFHAQKYVNNQRPVLIITAIIIGLFAAIAGLAAARVVGMLPAKEDYWYGAGVPVLAFQSLGSLFCGLGLSSLLNKWVKSSHASSKRVDLIIFLVLWVVTAWLWAREPAKPNFFITNPVAPNFEEYPDYDARNFDIMSQFALIGQGINNSKFYDRALYPAFLVYLHNFVGQDYQRLAALQAALFALLPSLLYLIAKCIHNRAAGLGLGMLVSLRGLNQLIAGDIIDTAHQKQLMTEYPTAILLALATYLLVKWARNPARNWHLASLAGVMIGLSTLLRPHPLALIPVFVALFGLVYRHKTRMWLGVSCLFISAAILSVLPWAQFSGHNMSIANLYIQRMNDVIRERYPQIITTSNNHPQLKVTPLPKMDQSQPTPSDSTASKSVLAFVTDNFLNNLVTSIQSLPTTPFILEPRIVIKKTESFWMPYWDGSLTLWARIFIPINLLLVALGIGSAWIRARFTGLIPLLFLLTYFVANALARTSGGRYIVPVDWIVVLYYMIGMVTLTEFSLAFIEQEKKLVDYDDLAIPISSQSLPNSNELPGKRISFERWQAVLTVLLMSTILGSLIPVAQIINPLRYQPSSSAQLQSQFIAVAGETTGVSSASLEEFLSNKDAVILIGRSLYPRQFIKNEGLGISTYTFYRPLPYPRTIFTIIGPAGEKVIILPRILPASIANSSDIMVVGCKKTGYIQAWAVISLQDNHVFSSMPPSAKLHCPLSEPVCDNNKNCH